MKSKRVSTSTTKIHCIGGGISSLSAAFFLIRDAGVIAKNITIYEELSNNGGCLDGSGNEKSGYLSRGGRMFEKHFVCLFDMLTDIPFYDEGISVKDDIFKFNEEVVSDANCRLLKNGLQRIDVSTYGLSFIHLLYMNKLLLFGKGKTNTKINDYFPKSFFKTQFWYLWTTSFSFQPWSNVDELRRYFLRFIHLLPGFNKFKKILRTRYNQYDALIVPVENWLKKAGVTFIKNSSALNFDFKEGDALTINKIHLQTAKGKKSITVKDDEVVFITPGSMVERSTSAKRNAIAPLPADLPGPAWTMWRNLARHDKRFGNPNPFICNTQESQWLSFTVTQSNPKFFEYIQKFSTDIAGTGGLISFVESNWFFSIVLFNQPFYKKQKSNSFILWGYGLYPENKGNYVTKPMLECTGDEILREVFTHFELNNIDEIISYSNCNTARMPYITSQFQTRPKKARPQVIPDPNGNVALLGQFVELKDDVVFTVEYSVRTAMTAVYSMFKTDKTIPKIYKGQFSPKVLFQALLALLR